MPITVIMFNLFAKLITWSIIHDLIKNTAICIQNSAVLLLQQSNSVIFKSKKTKNALHPYKQREYYGLIKKYHTTSNSQSFYSHNTFSPTLKTNTIFNMGIFRNVTRATTPITNFSITRINSSPIFIYIYWDTF